MSTMALAAKQDHYWRSRLEAEVILTACARVFPDDEPRRVLATAARTCKDMIDRRPVRRWRLDELERLLSEVSAECLRRTGSPSFCGTINRDLW